MAMRFGPNTRVNRTGVDTWVVTHNGVTEYSGSSKRAAISIATGLANGNAGQADRFGNLKTAAGEVQVITLTGYAGTDSFKLIADGVETAAFVRGTNAAASDLQTALRTATGDSTLTVSGTTDEGPFTVTWVGEKTAQTLLQQGAVSGCTLAVTRSTTGGVGV